MGVYEDVMIMENQKQVNRAGVIDIGSHSIKLIIGEAIGDDVKIIELLKHLLPIGKDTFYKNIITQETIKQTINILSKYKKVLEEYAITDIRVIATNAVREANNKDIFIDSVYRKTGFRVEVLTVGDVIYFVDSYISYKLKDKYPTHEKNLLIAELSAGAIEFSIMENGYVVMSRAAPLGSLQLKQIISKLKSSQQKNLEAVKEYFENELEYIKRFIPTKKIDDIILISEDLAFSIENILKEKRKESTFFTITKEEALSFASKCEGKSADEIMNTHKLPFDIAEITGIFSIILSSFFTFTENKYIYVLETSLYEAVLSHMLEQYTPSRQYKKIDHLIAMTKSLCTKYNVNINHSEYVANLSKTIFTSLREILGLQQGDLLHLLLASYLHDIGMFISNRVHHKHSEYIISSLNLSRLEEEDMKTIAAIARYHRKAAPSPNHPLYASLPAEKQIKIQKMSAILRISNSLDRSHKQKIRDLTVKIDKDQNIVLTAIVSGNFILEEMDFDEKKKFLEDITGTKISLKVTTKT
ncbi:MAG: HD domain-containing protein [Candidatus Hydrogenedentota bacterium]